MTLTSESFEEGFSQKSVTCKLNCILPFLRNNKIDES